MVVKIELSDVPSEMIEQALQDLERVEQDARYRVDMSDWHEPTETDKGRRVCSVCLAGAVLARCGASPNNYWSPTMLDSHWSAEKLYALNHLRIGDVSVALKMLNLVTDNPRPYDDIITPYDKDPVRFKADMRALAATLREAGL